MSQSQSPFTDLVAWVGMAGLSFVLVWLVAFLIQLVREHGLPRSTRALTAGIAVAATLAVPAWPALTEGTSRIAAVQGNSDAGLFAVHAPGDILSDHVSASLPLASSTRAHSRRTARNLAIVGNCSSVAASRNSIIRADWSTVKPSSASRRR